MESIKIIAFSIAAACVYGIAHDLVTAHVCIEYFLPPMHPIIVPTDSPFLLALIWGIVATWWVGLLLGIPLAVVCRFGQRPKLTVKNIVRPVLFLLIILYIVSMLLGVVGYIAGQMKWIWLLPPLADAVVPERHALFLFDLWAHLAAYVLGAIGGIMLMYRLWKKR
jgi:hypothetical protein